jgi:hypothetical protein
VFRSLVNAEMQEQAWPGTILSFPQEFLFDLQGQVPRPCRALCGKDGDLIFIDWRGLR